MANGVERKYGGVTIVPKWRMIVGKAVPDAETMEVNPDSAKDGSGHIEPFPGFPKTGFLSFSARLQASE